MKSVVYPNSGFLDSVKIAVVSQDVLEISISPGWRRNFIIKVLPQFLAEEMSEDLESKKSWIFVVCLFAFPRFFAAYFYAKAAGYRCTCFNDEYTMILKPEA